MYVPFDIFKELTLGDVSDPSQGITEEQYSKVAPMADAIIDHWTLDRVGKAVKNGEELPDIVSLIYTKIIESMPDIMDGTKIGKGGLVSSFSNGIDSYSFDVSEDMEERMLKQFGWMLEMLPVEWGSICVPFEGGNKYAG